MRMWNVTKTWNDEAWLVSAPRARERNVSLCQPASHNRATRAWRREITCCGGDFPSVGCHILRRLRASFAFCVLMGLLIYFIN